MKKLLACCLVVSFLAVLPTTVLAEQGEKYVVGVENITYYPQYSYEEGEYIGVGRAILDKFAEQAGYDFEYQAMPVNRLFEQLVADEIDFKYPDNEYWSADQKEGADVSYSQGVVRYIDGVVVQPENQDYEVEDLDRLGIVQGFTAFDYLDLIEEGEVRTSEFQSFEALLRQAIAGRVDGSYSNVAVVDHYLEKMGMEGELVFNSDLPHTDSYYHLSTTKHPEIIDEFDQFLTDNQEEIRALKEDYDVLLDLEE